MWWLVRASAWRLVRPALLGTAFWWGGPLVKVGAIGWVWLFGVL